MNPTGSNNNGGHQRPPPPSGGPAGLGPPFRRQAAGGMPPQQQTNGTAGNPFASGGGFSFGTMPTPPPPGGIGTNGGGGAHAGQQQQQPQQAQAQPAQAGTSASSGMPFPFDMGMMAAGQPLLQNNTNHDGLSENNNSSSSSHGSQQVQHQQQQQQHQAALFQQMQQNQHMLQMMQQAQQAAMGAGSTSSTAGNTPGNISMVDPTSAGASMMMQQMMGMMAASASAQNHSNSNTNTNTGAGDNGMAMAPNNLPLGTSMPMTTNHPGGGGGIVRQNTPRPPQCSQRLHQQHQQHQQQHHQQQQLQQIQPKPTTTASAIPTAAASSQPSAATKRSLVPLAPAPDAAPTIPAKAFAPPSSSSPSKKKEKATTKKAAPAAASSSSASTSSSASGGRKRKAGHDVSDGKPEASSDGDASTASGTIGRSDNSADGTSAFASLASPADEASAFHGSAAAGNGAASSTNDGNVTTSSSAYSSAGASTGTTCGLSISSSVQPSLPPEHARRLLPPTLLGAGHTGFAGIGDAANQAGGGGGPSSGRVLLSAKEQLAAAAAAADAIVMAESAKGGADGASTASGAEGGPAKRGRRPGGSGQPLSAEEKARLHRDRNREHARSTRLRKKAYVNKLKELVDTLRTERSEEAKRRRVAVQHLGEVQRVRRAVVNTFLTYHTTYESDRRKWATIVEEDGFVFKQPVTPYRYFRRSEIDKECRITSDIDSLVNDGASMSVMMESIGSRSPRWMQIKREDFLTREEARTGGATSERRMPHSIVRQNSRLQHAVSSLSSSSGSSSGNGSGAEEDARRARAQTSRRGDSKGSNAAASSLSSSVIKAGGKKRQLPPTSTDAKKVSSSSSGGGSGSQGSQGSRNPSSSGQSSNDFHEYNAPDLPDPMLDTNSTGSDSPTGSGDDAVLPGTKRPFSSNGEDGDTKPSATKRYKASPSPTDREGPDSGGDTSGTKSQVSRTRLPPNIAKKGGISHDIKPMALEDQDKHRTNPRLNSAPAIPLPPFTGLGKRSAIPVAATTVGAAIVNKTPSALGSSGETNSGSGSGSSGNEADNENDTTGAPNELSKVGISTDSGSAADSTSSSSVTGGFAARSYQGSAAATEAAVIGDNTSSSSQSGSQSPEITCTYHVNEDDMLLTDDVLMCPFIFRSRDAVVCGALAECVQPGMLRAQFSPRNKLVSFELVFDAMGFMQQLERASGSEGSAQIVPNSLEMALSPNPEEARVITMAKPPFMIVSVNEAWTRMTKYTQMEAEGKDMTMLNGKRTDPKAGVRSGKPPHDFVEVAKGRSACSVNCHYDKHGGDFIDFVSSYPLTNANDEVTHLLHVCRKLPVPVRPGDIEFGSLAFRELDTTTSNTDSAALTQ